MDSPGFQRRHRLPRRLESLALCGSLRRLHRFGHRQLSRLRHRSRRRNHGRKSLDRSPYFRRDDRTVDVRRAARLARWKVGHECRQLPHRPYHRSPRTHALHPPVARLAVLLLFTNYLSTFCLNFTANSRLPMVAGWDHLLPEWFTRLHAKYKTPVNSIFFLSGITVATSVVVLAGVGDQEAFELLQIWGFTFYGFAYLALFAIPLLARKERGIRPGLWLRFAAASGFLVTLLFVLLSIFPIISVKSESAYAIKTAAVLIGAEALGLLLYRLGSRGRSSSNAA